LKSTNEWINYPYAETEAALQALLAESIRNKMDTTFFDQKLLQTEYVKKYQQMADEKRGYLPHRNHQNLISSLSAIYEYNESHARSFVKRIKSQEQQWRDCEAVYTEIIVYSYYLRLFYEGFLSNISLQEADYDLRIRRIDGSEMYLEAFCIMPEQHILTKGAIRVNHVMSQTQEALSSIRQKLLNKIKKQKQMNEARENFAVIELNDFRIAGDFHILSSLSSGYKVTYVTEGKNELEVANEGYDWTSSVFDDPATKHLKGIIYFSLGNYADRKLILNSSYSV
jgi:hypothetical protein